MKIKGRNSVNGVPDFEDHVRIVTKNGLYKIQAKDGNEWKDRKEVGIFDDIEQAKKIKEGLVDHLKNDWVLNRDTLGWKVVNS